MGRYTLFPLAANSFDLSAIPCSISRCVPPCSRRMSWEIFIKKTVDGGCNKTYKRGDKTDKAIEELVIAKLERDAATKAQAVPDWDKAEALERALQSRRELERRWHDDADTDIDDEAFFRNLPVLERRIKELRADQRAHEALRAEAEEAQEDVRKSWGSKTLTQKREAMKKVLSAVIAVPGGKGNKTFDPDLLKPVWRTSE